MKIREHLLHRNSPEHRFHLSTLFSFWVYTGCIFLCISMCPLLLNAEETETETPIPIPKGVASATENSERAAQGTESEDGASSPSDSSTAEPTTETITGTSKRMERFEKEGITILIDEAKTVRYNEQGVEVGFLNADKITLKSDLETGATTEVVAVGNVEIRDQDIFATCDHAIMNNLTNTVVLKENVVVLQNKDRLETKLFTFNRTTGKQTGEGGVKFKVTVTQAEPVETAGEEETESGASAAEETEGEVQEDANAEVPQADGDAGAGASTDTDSEDETDTNTEDPNDTDGDAEADGAENN